MRLMVTLTILIVILGVFGMVVLIMRPPSKEEIAARPERAKEYNTMARQWADRIELSVRAIDCNHFGTSNCK